MVSISNPQRARLISVAAATVISLACGTNYVYSAWAPQYAQRLKLSATESNLIGTFGNLGMYASGIPFGMMIDAKGPRWGVALGTVLFAAGYWPLATAFDAGPGVYSVATLCLFSFFTGAGSCSAFGASIKASALNYPESRGTATAFPLAAFGLSAFFFATLALAVPHDTSHFLLLLAIGTVVMPTVSFFFLRVIPVHSYQHVSQHDNQILRRRKSSELRNEVGSPTAGAQRQVLSNTTNTSRSYEAAEQSDETSSLLSRSSDGMPDTENNTKHIETDRNVESPHLDIRGFALVRLPEFWQLFCMLGLMTGIGLMTINNIGNDAQALWKHYDLNTPAGFIAQRQVMHVSIISFCSFSGRLLSGIGSDILVGRYNRSRFWCIFASASLFMAAQLAAVTIQHPTLLTLVSGLTGIAYGMLFGVYPSLVAHAFGVNGLSQNWGTMTMAPVISGNIFNILYGRIYDSHSLVEENGDRECLEGKSCYSAAYWVTFVASLAAIILCLWSVHHENEVHKGKEKARRRSDL